MRSTKALQAAYGLCLKDVIRESGDPKAAMDAMAFVAENARLIDNPNDLRRSSPEEFVMDLWTENPVIRDRLTLSRENLPKPSAVLTLIDALDVLQ